MEGIALRQCPELPATIAGRLADYRARNCADWVMYRKALAAAAEGRGWRVHWYDSRKVFALAGGDFAEVRRVAGPPWGRDERLAMAAAVAACRANRGT